MYARFTYHRAKLLSMLRSIFFHVIFLHFWNFASMKNCNRCVLCHCLLYSICTTIGASSNHRWQQKCYVRSISNIIFVCYLSLFVSRFLQKNLIQETGERENRLWLSHFFPAGMRNYFLLLLCFIFCLIFIFIFFWTSVSCIISYSFALFLSSLSNHNEHVVERCIVWVCCFSYKQKSKASTPHVCVFVRLWVTLPSGINMLNTQWRQTRCGHIQTHKLAK